MLNVAAATSATCVRLYLAAVRRLLRLRTADWAPGKAAGSAAEPAVPYDSATAASAGRTKSADPPMSAEPTEGVDWLSASANAMTGRTSTAAGWTWWTGDRPAADWLLSAQMDVTDWARDWVVTRQPARRVERARSAIL